MGGFKQIRQTDRRTGRTYVYETQMEYDKAKKRTVLKNRRLIGHVDEGTGEVVPNRPTKAQPSSAKTARRYVGASILLDHVVEATGIREDLCLAAPGIADKALSLAYYLVVEDSGPMSRFGRFDKTHAHPYGREITSQRASEAFSSLGADVAEGFCRLRSARREEGGYWFYDTTSISSYSEGLRCARWGKNKDGAPLAQINLAVLMDAPSGLPFYFRRMPGNIADVSTVRKLLDDVRHMGTGKARIACDRGFWSAKNINAMMAAHIKFLIGASTSLAFVKVQIKEHSAELRSWQSFDESAGLFGLKVPVQWGPEGAPPQKGVAGRQKKRAYLHIYYSAARAAEDEGALAALLKACSRELGEDNRIEAHERYYDAWFKRGRGGVWAGRSDAIDEARSLFGYFALFTNDASLTPKEALGVYRGKDSVEKAFSDIKTRLDFRTPKVSTEEALDGKILVVFISLIIVSWLKQKMAESGLGERWTLQGLVDEVDTIERFERPGHKARILEVTKKQKEIFEALGFEAPVAS